MSGVPGAAVQPAVQAARPASPTPVRGSDNPTGPRLSLTPAAWTAFLGTTTGRP
ncbi:DUF397 domain-containing protein [Streptomyces coelicoflavus]|uniref:DUF397 domain-containing protein n=1 Tax=Streptomyces coelicoflavus TaxID=285562 RepID=UPI000B06D4E5